MLLSRLFRYHGYFLVRWVGRRVSPGVIVPRLGLTLIALSVLLPVSVVPSLAASDTLIGEFDRWAAYHYLESGQAVCYVVSKPIKSAGKYSKRGEIFAFITRRSETKNSGEFNIAMGYTFKPGSVPKAQIGGQRFDLITQENRAWATNSVADKKLILAMKRGLKMIVKGVSSRGTLTTDTYSLVGFTSAYKAMSKKCGFE